MASRLATAQGIQQGDLEPGAVLPNGALTEYEMLSDLLSGIA